MYPETSQRTFRVDAPDESPKNKIRVLIADDYPIVKEGLCTLIGGRDDMELVAECSTGEEAREKYFCCSPDVAILALRRPVTSCNETISAIRRRDPGARLMVVQLSKAEEFVLQAIRAGARGLLLASASIDELFAAVECVAGGRTWVSAELRELLARRALEPELTQREYEVLRAVVAGKSNKEIGTALNIAEATVKVHVAHILGKLNVSGRTAAISVATQRGLVAI
jgi:DNA-binding NarL/FixJ family response regulator